MRKIIKFSAPWCGPCVVLNKYLKQIKTDIPIEDIDIDANPEAALKYGVRALPTMIMLENDKEIKRKLGVSSPTALEMWING